LIHKGGSDERKVIIGLTREKNVFILSWALGGDAQIDQENERERGDK